MQTKIDRQKHVADIVLSKLELLDGNCIIAGGAPRDWYLGKEATDIDAYLYYPLDIKSKQRIGLLDALGFKLSSSSENWKIPEMYEGNKKVEHLYNCDFLDEKVQIIFVKEPTFTSVVDTFPISISKAWYKRKKIGTDQDFDISVKHKIIWKTVDVYSEDNKYINKIKNKFSDYKYVTEKEMCQIVYGNQETKAEGSYMKIVIISSDFDEALPFQGNFSSIVDGFKQFIKDKKMSNKTFIKAYGDWKVYSEKNDFFTQSLVEVGMVENFIE